MKTEPKLYDNFPVGIILLSNGLSLILYVLGFAIIARLHILLAVGYLLYCFYMEMNLLRGSCVHCFYYGKVCAFGKGMLCSLLFKRGDPKQFIERTVSWREIIPDIMVLLFPLVAGTVALVRHFTWPLLFLMAGLTAFSLAGNGIVRGTFTCPHCRQRELGCPAEKLFRGKEARTACSGDAHP